jgi:putative two-component system response regulator
MNTLRKTIFVVDDNTTNLVTARGILSDRYRVFPVASAQMMFELLEDVIPDLILLDIEMPDMDGYEAIKSLKGDARYREIPVIFLTAMCREDDELEGLELGAIDYITKPFSAALLLQRLENHLLSEAHKRQLKAFNESLEKMVDKKAKQVLSLQFSILDIIADLVEFRDSATGGHISRTQRYMELLIDQMVKSGVYWEEIARWDLDYLIPSTQLHDVGKIGISDRILCKPGKLTEEEFEIMKGHVAIGVAVIERMMKGQKENSFLKYAKTIASAHHEKWDGSGYPGKLAGKDIPLEGRIMAVVDVYDALVSERPYKKAFTHEAAKRIIIAGKGSHFDPAIVEVFEQVADRFPAKAQVFEEVSGDAGAPTYECLWI